jgi:hypothetical protein
MPRTLLGWVSVIALAVVSLQARILAQEKLEELAILKPEYPRAFFFRNSEGMARQPRVSYEQWDACFSRLMGICGKAEDEEIPGTLKRNPEFFTRFKKAHPEQLVLLHFNGNARDPRFDADGFFAGHWLYYNGAKLTADVPAQDGEMDIPVEDARLFRAGIGRYKSSNEDVGLCRLDEHGRPNWLESEQVQLVSVNVPKKIIRVKRGCYGTKPLAFPAGKAYAAAHVTEGPWGKNSNLLWFYNYSTVCPKDKSGRVCSDVLLEDLSKKLLPGGRLAAVDGITFDVMYHESIKPGGIRKVDHDADGKADDGIVDGVNVYGLGVLRFLRQLRDRLGDGRLILADGMTERNQRAFGIVNGIESEGWPTLWDWELKDWSGGVNRMSYWAAAARKPSLNYINHKYRERGDTATPQVPWSIHRTVFAVACFTDAAVCYSYAPPAEEGEAFGIWDELVMGTARKTGWLGKPLAPVVRLAEKQRDLLAGNGKIEPQADESQQRFIVRNVPCPGPDLLVTLTARAEPLKGYPAEMARMMHVQVAGTDPPLRFMSWAGPRDFTSTFYLPDVKSEKMDLEITVEGKEPVVISKLTAHAAADAIYRQFERGLVLCNPSPRPYTFDLNQLCPGQKFSRLQGSSRQDPATNNGQPTAGSITLGPKDSLFLVGQ